MSTMHSKNGPDPEIEYSDPGKLNQVDQNELRYYSNTSYMSPCYPIFAYFRRIMRSQSFISFSHY